MGRPRIVALATPDGKVHLSIDDGSILQSATLEPGEALHLAARLQQEANKAINVGGPSNEKFNVHLVKPGEDPVETLVGTGIDNFARAVRDCLPKMVEDHGYMVEFTIELEPTSHLKMRATMELLS